MDEEETEKKKKCRWPGQAKKKGGAYVSHFRKIADPNADTLSVSLRHELTCCRKASKTPQHEQVL